MKTPLPKPDTHCLDDDTGKDCWSHSADQIQAYGKAEYERGLLDAMNATRAFGRTGEVIAVIIAALKERKA